MKNVIATALLALSLPLASSALAGDRECIESIGACRVTSAEWFRLDETEQASPIAWRSEAAFIARYEGHLERVLYEVENAQGSHYESYRSCLTDRYGYEYGCTTRYESSQHSRHRSTPVKVEAELVRTGARYSVTAEGKTRRLAQRFALEDCQAEREMLLELIPRCE